MTEIRFTRDIFLRFVNVIYLFAFASLYVQIPGLYGKNGLLPASTELDVKETDYAAKLHKKPTLLWFAPYLGLDTEHMMDVLSLVGMFLAFTGFISQIFCTKPTFAALWSLYYSLYQVGQTFMWFQWDILLLETGFLCILVSPLRHKAVRNARSKNAASSPSDGVSFWLVKWLLFRLMFSSGIVKLTSDCPSWWGLSALQVHFESMCIPTPLAWYSHHLPVWFLKINTVFAIVAESALPLLFFFPVRAVRIVTFWIQMFLQVAIILTGNFTFFNYLTIALCMSLLDDDFFYKSTKKSSLMKKVFSFLVVVAVFSALLYGIYIFFGIKILPNGVVLSKISFTKSQFDLFLEKAIVWVVVLGAVSLLFTSLKALNGVISQSSSCIYTFGSLLSTLFYIVVALFIFSDSLVPFSSLHPAGNVTVHPKVRELHGKLSHLHLTNSYGLFRRITGVGGRPEVIIEGSNNLQGPWAEYNFLYKPGNVNQSLPFVAPHQPRLDWQMWFAALGTYHQNPWIMSLAYRLLTGQPEVLNLMDKANNPFINKPPKYIRASLFHYHYTTWEQRNMKATWTRQKVGEYFPVFSKDHAPLLDYLKNYKILAPVKGSEKLSQFAINGLDSLRLLTSTVDPAIFLLSLFISGISIILLGKFSQSPLKQSASGPPPTKQTQRRKK